jgi:hypothetical protein
MFVLMMVTLLVSRISMDFGMSLSSLERTELKYISFAAVNELLADLNTGLDRDLHTKENPRKAQDGGRTIESWVEPVEIDEDYIFAVSRTRHGSRGLVEEARRFAIFRPKINPKIYASVADTNKDSPDPIYYSDSGSWAMLPSIPRVRYSDSGVLESEPGEFAGSTPFYVGARDDSVYAIYAPTLDGWNDPSERAFFQGIPIPVLRFNWGDFVLHNLVTGTGQGQTSADLSAVPPIIHEVTDPSHKLTLTRGSVALKYSHATDEWEPLPPAPEATFDGEKFVETPGDYWVQGVPGPMSAHDQGLTIPVSRDGQDAIYQWNNDAEKWNVVTPPGKDVLVLASDQGGTSYVQTGNLQRSSLTDLLKILAGDFKGVTPKTNTSALHRQKRDGTWVDVPNPPAKFFDKRGELQSSAFPGSGGPLIGSMVGGEAGELYVVSRPNQPGLVDTIYKYDYSDDEWEVVPSPSNTYYDGGVEVERDGLPDRLDLALAADGEVSVRIPTEEGDDPIFVRDEKGEYELLPAVQTPGGGFEKTLYQISGGGKPVESGAGTYIIRATYF